jgi:hypothetical protein
MCIIVRDGWIFLYYKYYNIIVYEKNNSERRQFIKIQ